MPRDGTAELAQRRAFGVVSVELHERTGEMLLHPVTGDAKFCAPCAWSALTGLSSNSWIDGPKTDAAEYHEFERQRFESGAPFYVEFLPERWESVALSAFDQPGRWALTVAWEGDDETHAVAVGIEGAERVLVDNHIRAPMALDKLMEQRPIYRTAVILSGLQLVPDHENPFSLS